jgi:hypothetical protein
VRLIKKLQNSKKIGVKKIMNIEIENLVRLIKRSKAANTATTLMVI